jgi:transposase
MPWAEVTRVSLREEFVQLAMQAGVNRRELCRRLRISPKTAYKWLARYTAAGPSGLRDRSRRPRQSPTRTVDELAERVIELRRESRNSWGGRKLARLLAEEGGPRLAPSTITGILRRAGLLDPALAPGQHGWQRFEHVAPNALWQMDFKGYFPLLDQSRCHPLTVLDDHSRFAVLLQACPDQRGATVQHALTSPVEETDSQREVLFCHQVIARIDLNETQGTAGNKNLPRAVLSISPQAGSLPAIPEPVDPVGNTAITT